MGRKNNQKKQTKILHENHELVNQDTQNVPYLYENLVGQDTQVDITKIIAFNKHDNIMFGIQICPFSKLRYSKGIQGKRRDEIS